MKKLTLTLLLLLSLAPLSRADEGMWLLPLLKQQNYARMQQMGLTLAPEEIYNQSGTPSLVDAVVHFGGGCTGEVVSPQGLIFTNHHCGYGEIQSHSSVDHNYLREGFYAPTLQDELPNPGLTVTFTDEIVDLTHYVAEYFEQHHITDPSQQLSRNYLREVAFAWYQEHRGTCPEYIELDLAPIYHGNQYYLFIRKVYSDVRLVAAPPSFIGSYGSDTDNWTWPRHSGDFSVFRVYTAPDGTPAQYSTHNVPLQPKNYLKLSRSGVKENDFVMIIGFPGTTRHFSTAGEVAQFRDVNEQIRIDMRKVRQDALYEEMMKDEVVYIQYASKYQGSTNAYKRAIGNNWASRKMGFEAVKRAEMEALRTFAQTHNKPEYIQAMEQIEQVVAEREALLRIQVQMNEGLWRPIEILRLSPVITSAQAFEQAKQQPQQHLQRYLQLFDKDYNQSVDRKVTKAMLKAYTKAAPHSPLFATVTDTDAYTDSLFNTSIYRSAQALQKGLATLSYQEYTQDPLVSLYLHFMQVNKDVAQELSNLNASLHQAKRTYQRGMLEMHGELALWPDANSTLRYTFGQVKGYSPRDQVYYGYQTTLTGVFEKEDPTSDEYYILPPLRKIYEQKNYGSLALPNGDMPVNFCATTHTTGGNSGSPVLNAQGHLVGLNFDRNWEGVGGDIQYLPAYQRSIICDVRYLLLILDQYLGAQRLIEELEIVE